MTYSVHSLVGFYTSADFAFLEIPSYVVTDQQPTQVEGFKSAPEGTSTSTLIEQKICFSTHGDIMKKRNIKLGQSLGRK